MRKQILSSAEHNEASGTMGGLDEVTYGVDTIQFVQVTTNTTFRAEYGVKDEKHLVFHFFGTEEANALKDPWYYWLTLFPAALEQTAVEHFKTAPPYLHAAYSDDLYSWWLQADGVATKVLDVDAYAQRFLDKLDTSLDDAIKERFGAV